MINKKQFSDNAKRKKVNGVEDRRFSKAKFRKENGSMSLSEKKAEESKSQVKTNNADYYRQKYDNFVTRNRKSFNGNVESVTCMILTEPSMKADGYKVLPKGQCVIVATFSNSPYRMVKANDGRIGIIPTEKGAKPISI
nr:MAG TPA: hypothetical protein [Caudoviricetes sp.]